jgi:NTP pyrophosphatase (non-canonical NTP hydrolase)
MELRKICDDTRDMGMWELAHNQVFVKDKEAWYRNFEREISVRDLVREIYRKHVTTEDAEELADDEVFDDVMLEAGYYGTDNMEGVCSILYTALWGMADVREWLKAYETHGLPTAMQPEVLQSAVDTYGKEAQVDVAIEEMSELIKALLKNRRAEHSPEAWDYEKTRQNIFEEIADVVIMLTQLLMIFGGRDAVQKAIDAKVERLATRLAGAAKEAGADAAQDTLQSAT